MTNAASAAGDAYYVYRPVLDLLGKSEGTDKGRGYNETLGYGAYTGNVNLVGMTLAQIDALQGKMLANPKNKWKSSALGRYQIVRTTRRNIQKALSLPAASKFDEEMQDRMACYLLGQRGIDKWLAGRLKLDSLIDNLAREWASIPTSKGKGFYSGQNAGVSASQVKAALGEVAKRHAMGQPVQKIEIPVEVEKPVVPDKVEQKVKEKSNWWTKVTGGGGIGGLGLGFLTGVDWKWLATGAGILIVVVLIFLLLKSQIIAAVRDIKNSVEQG